MPDNYDKEVILGLSDGDRMMSPSELKKRQKRFQEFYEMHYEISFRYLRAEQFTGDEIADLLSHAFELAWKNFDEYSGIIENTVKKKYWFFGILKNASKYAKNRKFRHQEKNLSLDSTPETLQISGNQKTPEEILVQKEEESYFAAIIDSLPEKYSSVVRLRLEGFDYKEISSLLDLSVDAAEMRMRRALVKLQPALQEFREKHYRT